MSKKTVVVKEQRVMLEPRVQAGLAALRKPELAAGEMFSSRFDMQAVAKFAGVSWVRGIQRESVFASVMVLDMCILQGSFMAAAFSSDFGVALGIVSGGLLGAAGITVPTFTPIDRWRRGRAVYAEVYRQNFEAFTVWLKSRYELEIDFGASGYSLQELNRDLAEVKPAGMRSFVATNGGSYTLALKGGEFYVKEEEKKELVGEAPTFVGVLDMFVSSEEFHPVYLSWADVEHRVEALQKFSLTVEQKHVLERAVREAEDALQVFRSMRLLDAGVDAGKVTEVIAGISAEVDKVTGLGSKLDISSALVKDRTGVKVPGSLSLS